MSRKPKDPDLCPICQEYMDIRCVGHKEKPFVDGRTYDCICFVCFSIPKTWEISIGTDGEPIFEGPYFDQKHLYTAEEMLEEGIVDDIKRAKKSIKALKQRFKKTR